MPQNVKFDLQTMLSAPPANPQYAKAAELTAEIKNCAETAQENLYRMAMGFKRMRDEKLYTALGYQSFGEYCEKETGMKRQNVYRYIDVVEKLPYDLSHRCDKIGVTKLQLLTSLSDEERNEIIECTDLENTSVRELREIIKELEKEKDELRAECILTDTKRKVENEQFEKRIDALIKAGEITRKDIDKLLAERSELEAQIADLESRPIEVAVQSDSREIENLKDAMKRVDLDWSEKYAQLENENMRDRRELLQKIDELENREAPAADEQKLYYDFCVKQAEKALNTLLKACLNYDGSHFEAKRAAENFIDNMDRNGL